MSNKFSLVRDRETEGAAPAIARYLWFLLFLLIGLGVVILILNAFSFGGAMMGRALTERAAEIAAQKQEAKNAVIAQASLETVQRIADGSIKLYAAKNLADADIYTGPGLRYPVAGSVQQGEAINLVARNAAGTWYLLDNGFWVNGRVISGSFPGLAVLDR